MLLLASLAAKEPVVAEHDAALGAQAEAIARIVQQQFAGDIRRVMVAIVAAAACIGLVLGGAAGVLVDVHDAMLERSGVGRRGGPRWRLARALAITLALEAWFLFEAMARRPQLYADRFYAHGGIWRTTQVLVTDVFGPFLIASLGAALFVAYGLGLPRAWPRYRVVLRQALGRGTHALGLLTALLSMHAAPPAPASAPTPPPRDRALALGGARPMNVLILAADSLRADRLNARTMPKTDAFAARGARFERAYVSLPRTFPSWVTLLTGRYAHRHGITTMFPTWRERARDFDALPANLAKAGYRTAVVSDYAGDIFSRIDLGFGEVATPTFDFAELIRQRALERQTPLLPFLDTALGRAAFPTIREFQTAADPRVVADEARAVLRGREPFFATVFLSAAHFPYAAASPYYKRFTDPAYRGRFKYHKPVGLAGEAELDADDVRQVQALYDGAVLSVDDAFAQILRELEDRGLAERTIVVVTADHGETLFEHGRWHGHGDHLFGDEGVHVPLVMVDPRANKGVRAGQVVRDVDLAATLYELTGTRAAGELDGRSLAPLLAGAALEPKVAVAESELWMGDTPGIPAALRMPVPPVTRLLSLDTEHHSEIVLREDARALTTMARHRMARDERWKLLYIPTREGVVFRLFDTEKDPAELVDVAAKHPAEVARLKGELFRATLMDKRLEQRGDYLLPRE